jgi:hypothetical protein
MLDQEPLWYPSRGPFNPGVSNRQLWAIGMIVVQWGMAEFIRNQSIHNLIRDDSKLTAEYKSLRRSDQITKFWKMLVEIKTQEPEQTKNLHFITRFQGLNDKRDNVVHRMWGGGIEADTLGAPSNAPTTDSSLHRKRDEKKKTKSRDGRANLVWYLDYSGLREIAHDIGQLNQDILASWIPPESPPGMYHIWAYPNADGKLEVGIASATESDPHLKD